MVLQDDDHRVKAKRLNLEATHFLNKINGKKRSIWKVDFHDKITGLFLNGLKIVSTVRPDVFFWTKVTVGFKAT